MLTSQQLTALKADILADSILAAQPTNDDGNEAIAKAYNLSASPAFTVWKTNVSINQIGDKLNGTELGGLTTANQTRLQTIALFSEAGVNPSLSDRRQFFDDVFSGAGGANTRANLLVLWKRLTTRAEKLFATGTGTDAVPGLLTFEGAITRQDVSAARNLP